MLEDAKAMAVIAVRDLGRARIFWEKMVGLHPQEVHEAEGEAIYVLNGTGLVVYETEAPQGEATKAALMVDDLGKEMEDLKNHGAVFQDFDLPHLKTINSVAEGPHGKAAWFKDLDANYIGLMEAKKSG